MAVYVSGIRSAFIRLSYLYCLLLFLVFLHVSLAIYEDQVGLFDWRQQYIGEVKFVYFDQYSHSSRRALVATEANVIAALNARTGALVWRHVFEQKDDRINNFLHYSNILISVSGNGRVIRSWDPVKGHLIWETVIQDNGKAAFDNNPLAMKSKLIVKKSGSFTGLASLHRNTVYMHSAKNGEEVWKFPHMEPSVNSMFVGLETSDERVIVYGVSNDNNLIFHVLDVETGKMLQEKSIEVLWYSQQVKFKYVGERYLVCFHPETRVFYTIDMVDFKTTSTPLDSIIDVNSLILDNCAFSNVGLALKSKELAFRCERLHILSVDSSTGHITSVTHFPLETLLVASTIGSKSLLVAASRSTEQEEQMDISTYNTDDYKELVELKQTIRFSSVHGNPQRGVLYAFSRKDNDVGFRLLVVNEDQSLCLIQNSGKVLWEREEALSGITVVEMVELPPAASEAKLELLHEEFSTTPSAGIVSMFVKRIKVQLKQLEVFMRSLKKRKQYGELLNEEKDDSEKLGRDQFNLHKVLIVMTKVGKLYGIDSSGGAILWSHFLKDMKPFETKVQQSHYLFTQRTTAHFPLPPQCIVFGTHVSASKSMLYAFNPLNGKAIETINNQGEILPYHILQVSVLPFTDEKFTKVALIVDQERHVHIYPKTKESVEHLDERMKSIFLYLINQESGTLQGFTLKKEENSKGTIGLEEAWSMHLPDDQRIEKIVHKRLDEHVHSVGRVLGDRSVLYKYLNPNVVAVVTLSASGYKSALTIYVLDAVTGQVIYHAKHRNGAGPVEMVLSEHWLVYVYSNLKARRSETVVVEMYEGFDEKNSTAFSSLDPLLRPMILSQGYVIPFPSITKMDVTNTLHGITHKNLLLALESGYVYALPKNLLDPRRSFDHTQELMEEGLIPYMPELPLNPLAFINYNLTVEKIRGIHTSAAGLESTSLVLVYGLDVYFTRVTPSKMFDVLKEDFDYIFTSGVLSALILATIISSKLASMRTLKLAWL